MTIVTTKRDVQIQQEIVRVSFDFSSLSIGIVQTKQPNRVSMLLLRLSVHGIPLKLERLLLNKSERGVTGDCSDGR